MVTWVVIANSTSAHIYCLSHQQLNLIVQLTHPQSSKKGQELTSDRSGEYGVSYFGQSSSYSPPHQPKEIEADRFASTLVNQLEHARNLHQFDNLNILAPPHFLGLLESHFPKPLKNCIQKTIAKNLVHLSKEELEHFLKNALRY